jgi:hypothetical protein
MAVGAQEGRNSSRRGATLRPEYPAQRKTDPRQKPMLLTLNRRLRKHDNDVPISVNVAQGPGRSAETSNRTAP